MQVRIRLNEIKIRNISFLRCDKISFLYFMTSLVFSFIVHALQIVLKVKLTTAVSVTHRFKCLTCQLTLHNWIQIAVKVFMVLKFNVPQSSSPLNPCG